MKKSILFILLTGVIIMGLFGCGSSDKNLVSFIYSSGGGMTGGGRRTDVTKINDKVYLTDSSSEYWFQDYSITEYEVDKAILDEIAAVYDKYNMNRWNNKKFSDMVVEDGESYSYSFTFDDGTHIGFSSQIYPPKYRDKLYEIHDIISRYRSDSQIEPGLVVKKQTDEEQVNKSHPDSGIVEAEVYEYSRDSVYFRILNGTGEAVSTPNEVRLVNSDTDALIYEKSGKYELETGANSYTEESIRLNERLAEGNYTLTVGDLSISFEIRRPN